MMDHVADKAEVKLRIKESV